MEKIVNKEDASNQIHKKPYFFIAYSYSEN